MTYLPAIFDELELWERHFWKGNTGRVTNAACGSIGRVIHDLQDNDWATVTASVRARILEQAANHDNPTDDYFLGTTIGLAIAYGVLVTPHQNPLMPTTINPWLVDEGKAGGR